MADDAPTSYGRVAGGLDREDLRADLDDLLDEMDADQLYTVLRYAEKM